MNSLKSIKILLWFLLILPFASCNKWVDIEPKDRITENMLFSTKEGFLKALNGVYAELNTSSLYGRELTVGMLEAMAQNYNARIADHQYLLFSNYSYTDATVKTRISATWSKAFTLIANCNAILEKCGDANPVLPENYFRIVKGESLALRAMLHFDLLRMFGPIYNDANKQVKCIPYATLNDRRIQPLLSAEEVLKKIQADLKAARELLSADPVITEGRLNNSGVEKNDMNYRQYRLNYFAVNALLARTALWSGDKPTALEYAKDVIAKTQAPGAELFPFITLEGIRPSLANRTPDRVFSTEVLFAGYNMSRVNIYNALFAPTLNQTQLLTFPGSITEGRIVNLYDNQNDYRKGMWATTTVDNREVIYLKKYEDVSDRDGVSESYRYMMPLIRLSEMYLIVAECATHLDEAKIAFNKLRVNRGCSELAFSTSEELNQQIMQEYIKEFLGEGQFFYYLKRKAMQNIPDGNRVAGGVIPMQLGNYVFPLPENEISQRNN